MAVGVMLEGFEWTRTPVCTTERLCRRQDPKVALDIEAWSNPQL